MSTIYRSRAGDTFEIIRVRKRVTLANLKAANPSIDEPIQAGTLLNIPTPDPVSSQNQTSDVDPDLFTLKLGTREFLFWTKAELVRSVESIHNLTINAPFEPDNPDHRALFQPFGYQRTELTVGGEKVFDGLVMGVVPSLSEDGRVVTLTCYSRPGPLLDCSPSPKSLPLEFKKVALSTIVQKVIEPFGLTAEFPDGEGAAFDKVVIGAEDKVFDSFVNLAKQRNLVISNTTDGALLFQRSVTSGREVAKIREEDGGPLLSIVPVFDPQALYSDVVGLLNIIVSENAIQEYLGNSTKISKQISIKNEFMPPNVLRPFVFKADAETDVNAKFGRMFSEAIAYDLMVDSFRDQNGNLWAPNTLVSVLAPSVMIYEPFIFLIKSVRFSSSPRTAVLKLVIPQAYAGEAPEKLPWS